MAEHMDHMGQLQIALGMDKVGEVHYKSLPLGLQIKMSEFIKMIYEINCIIWIGFIILLFVYLQVA